MKWEFFFSPGEREREQVECEKKIAEYLIFGKIYVRVKAELPRWTTVLIIVKYQTLVAGLQVILGPRCLAINEKL